MLNKWEKIDLVRKLNLNTEVNILITSSNPKELDKLDRFIILHKLDGVSIRTMSPTDSLNTPHYPVVAKKDIFPTIRELLSKGFYTIVATQIDPKDALLAGAVMKNDKTLYVELAHGPFTVRRVTHDGIIDIQIEYDITKSVYEVPTSSDDNVALGVSSILTACSSLPFKNCVAELSYYKIPVGEKNEQLIIWDISGDGTPESAKEVEDYYRNPNKV